MWLSRKRLLGVLLPLLVGAGACVSTRRLAIESLPQSCLAGAPTQNVRWRFTGTPHDRQESRRWCAAVGPPVVTTTRTTAQVWPETLTVVTWNTHVGSGDVSSFVNDLREGKVTGGRPVHAFVLLLQEVYREGTAVPARVPPGARTAGEIRHLSTGPHDRDIEATARTLGLALFYAPSMRNGTTAATAEDRGNAILSTLPIDDCVAIELPLERQRRVAVAATLKAEFPDGQSLTLRVVSAHLTNMVAHHGWVFAEPGRARQARALADVLDDAAIMLGGDFNTWFGRWDAAYRELAGQFNTAMGGDRRPTFSHLRLDHLFFRLPAGWAVTVRRADHRYGSDHFPLLAELRLRLN
jgi:endonuclease/exonuclease/phosphatase family metal-dependent hydrolase